MATSFGCGHEQLIRKKRERCVSGALFCSAWPSRLPDQRFRPRIRGRATTLGEPERVKAVV